MQNDTARFDTLWDRRCKYWRLLPGAGGIVGDLVTRTDAGVIIVAEMDEVQELIADD